MKYHIICIFAFIEKNTIKFFQNNLKMLKNLSKALFNQNSNLQHKILAGLIVFIIAFTVLVSMGSTGCLQTKNKIACMTQNFLKISKMKYLSIGNNQCERVDGGKHEPCDM